MEAVEAHYGLAQRWFQAKAAILGLERLELWDQYAPIGTGRGVEFLEARDLVEASFGRFSPRIAAVADEFFTGRRVDAEPRAGKRGGAFCAPVAQDAPAFVLMNFTDQMNDVMTLAHELGHGMHFTLSARAAVGTVDAHRARPGRGAVDVRGAADLRPSARDRDRRRHAARADLRAGRGVVRDRVPPNGPGALRAACLRGAQGGHDPHRRAPVGHLARRKPGVLRRHHRAARRVSVRLELHPPLHLDPLLHLRVRVRAPDHTGALRAVPRARGPRSPSGTWSSSRPADPRRPPTYCCRSGWICPGPTSGTPDSRR